MQLYGRLSAVEEAPEVLEELLPPKAKAPREDAEARRLMAEASKAFGLGDVRAALAGAWGASLELQALRAKEKPENARKLAQELLSAEVMQAARGS